MFIKKISLVNYRNYKKLNLSLDKKLNIIIGDNAQGKTNILESIYTVAFTKSFLGVKDLNLIKSNEIFSKIKVTIKNNISVDDYEVIINNDDKKIKVNGNIIKKYNDYISRINVLYFGPQTIIMMRDGPASRRKFLNIEISQLLNKYVVLLQKFNLILRQRNEYLRMIKVSNNCDNYYLDIINDKFCSLAIDIVLERFKFINLINRNIGDIYYKITDKKGLNIKYVSNVDINDDKNVMINLLKKKLEDNFEREKKYSVTLFGPHRDDFIFFLDDLDLSVYGSQGQYRAAVLSLKLSEVDIIKDKIKESPILLLDDIFSEFDSSKRNKLISYILGDIQTIITTTDLNLIDKVLIDSAKIFKISCGKLINDEKEGNKDE